MKPMKILYAAEKNAWGGFLGLIKKELPEHCFEATGRFAIDSLKGYDVLIPTMSPVTEAMIEKSDRLRLIQQCGSGLEGIDVNAAIRRNIWVANVPTDISGNADSVAELGIYMMIGLSRDIRGMSKSLDSRRMGEPKGKSLSGKTVGLVGLGGIGKALIKRLKAFDVRLIGVKRHDPQKAMNDMELDWVGSPDDLKTLLERSDFIILCLPLTSENRHIINRSAFRYMKRDAFLINLSRGGLVEREALYEALSTGRIAGAGLDVFWEEPPDPKDEIFEYNVIATPHVAACTDVSMQGIVRAVSKNIQRIQRGLEPFHHVNH